MKASEVARATGVSVYTVRYYQRIGLLAAPRDAHSGYHEFSTTDACAIEFVKRAQSLGLSLHEIRVIFERARHRKTPCPEVRDLVRQRLSEVEHQLAERIALRDHVRRLLRTWQRMPRATPNGDDVRRLIESLCASVDLRQTQWSKAERRSTEQRA